MSQSKWMLKAVALTSFLTIVTGCGGPDAEWSLSQSETADIEGELSESTQALKVGEIGRLKDGRVGFVSRVENSGVTVRVLNAQTKKIETLKRPVGDVTRPAFFEPGQTRFSHDSKALTTLRAYFSDETRALYPHLSDLSKIQLVTQYQKKWMDFNCIANSVGIRNQFVVPKLSLSEQDAFYLQYGFVPNVGPMATGVLRPQVGVEKVLIYAYDASSEPRHAAVQDADGVWNHKMGQGVHVRVANPYDMNGEDAGQPVRLYVRARK